MSPVSASSLLLRLFLIAMLVLNGAWSAFASVSMNPVMEEQASEVAAAVQVDEDCFAHHSAEHHPDATSIEKAGTGHGDHAGPTVASLLRAGAPAYTLARAHFLRACMFRCNWPWAWMSCRCP